MELNSGSDLYDWVAYDIEDCDIVVQLWSIQVIKNYHHLFISAAQIFLPKLPFLDNKAFRWVAVEVWVGGDMGV